MWGTRRGLPATSAIPGRTGRQGSAPGLARRVQGAGGSQAAGGRASARSLLQVSPRGRRASEVTEIPI